MDVMVCDVLTGLPCSTDPSPSPPVRDVGPLYSPYSEMEESAVNTNDSLEPHADLEGEAPDGSFANRNGRHAIGHVDDYSALQQQVMEGRALVQRMEAALQSSLSSALLEISGGKVMLRCVTDQSACANSSGVMCFSLTGSGLQHSEDAALRHQDLASDSGRSRVSAQDVLAGGASEQRQSRSSHSEGAGHA
uniref:Uncharacterized protein n=1 Tax=Sinocyclocheilus anshuiensis TaxID=1608454 RepID=A0A671P3E6_9TELE